MSRRVLVLGVVAACFALILWSGFQNRRAWAPIRTTIAPTPIAPPAQDADIPSSPLLDTPAPPFTLRDLSERRISLADYRGRVVLINFWATWCAPCRVEMPWLIDLQAKYSAQGFTVLGIDKDYPEDLSQVPGFVKQMKLNYPILYGDCKTYSAYGCCDYLPLSYYLDRSGTIRLATVGLGKREAMEAAVQLLLKGSPARSNSQITASAQPSLPASPR